ncbi:ribosomal protein S18 [Aulographum hederae CBS 113979]|uniref:Small ribosomal subunit protein bS18m n=1 Tax=Aulographum hederae CBS 113979 TaxID=1176131 RepID=A0A6G1GYQ3_9PEZI|nr:ribosomal protein S18 [Aulographum hederae CBS 113979]
MACRAPLRINICASLPHTRAFTSSVRHQQDNAARDLLSTFKTHNHSSPATRPATRTASSLKPSLGNIGYLKKKMDPLGKEKSKRLAFNYSMQSLLARKWQHGDVFAPHDLSLAENQKWKKSKKSGKKDVFDLLGMNPLDLYKNFAIMSEFITETGKIKHPRDTGLRPVNQRRLAKAIRRAVGVGLMPSVHKHPHVLAAKLNRVRQ